MTVYDGDEKAKYRKAQKKEKQRKAQLDRAVKAMLQHEDTRAYLYWLLEIGKAIGINPFTANALTTSFACGEQNVGQQIMAHLIEVSPDGFIRVLKEQEDAGRDDDD